MKTLECHSKGEPPTEELRLRRYSPFCCQVESFGQKASIENHYQRAKLFSNGQTPADWRQAKEWKRSMRQVGWRFGSLVLPVRSNPEGNSFALNDFGVQYYIGLWYKHLQHNPYKIEFASSFDRFHDPFKGNFPPEHVEGSQADVMSSVVSGGLESLLPLCREFVELLRASKSGQQLQIKYNLLDIQYGAILLRRRFAIAHQVNCMGVMGAGLALQIRDRWPEVYRKYRKYCNPEAGDNQLRLGSVQILKVGDNLFVANLAGQYNYGCGQQHTDYDALRTCLTKLSSWAASASLPVYLPYKMGCNLGGGDWETVSQIISECCPAAIICKL